ncbi:MAG: BPSS1187 family protein [Fimbriimonadales bacterium]
MALTFVAAVLLVAYPGASGVQRSTVRPSETDPAINTFDSPHSIFVDPDAKSRDELLVFLPGTNGKTRNTDSFCDTAAERGYMVINLMYPDSIPAAIVAKSKDRDDFLDFRLTVIEGKNLSKFVQVDRANSIENRLIKLLQYLDKKRPREHWDRYLTSDRELNWPKIAVSGLSQGAGHAALIATRHKVARAVLFGGPKDFDKATNQPAAWYKTPETPLRLIFTFNHEQDRQGCNFKQQMENCKAMGLDKLGKAVDVDSADPPFKNSHILSTNYPGTPIPSIQAHTSVVGDGSSPKTKDGGRLFKPVWIYMLTWDSP